MIDRTHSESGQPDLDQVNLGETLRRAREAREISIEDLARRLRLDPRTIRLLEQDQHEQLAGPAFARGYVRSIARELEMDPAPLIAIFDMRSEEDAPALSDFQSRAPLQISSDSNVIRYTTFALVVIMIVMAGLWWRAHEPEPPSLEQFGSDQSKFPSEPATDPLDYDYDIVQHSDEPFYRAPLPASELNIEPAPDAQTEPQTQPESQAEPAPAATDTEAMAVDEVAQADIVVSTRADAWIEIRDANDTRLHIGLVRPDKPLRVSGTRPYLVTIGNVHAVSLAFDGRVVALGQYSEKGVARLKLGAP